MAKLSAHGTIIARVRKEYPLRQSVIDATVVRHTKVLMSDGVILEKHSFYRPDGSHNVGGWKKLGPVAAAYANAVAWLALQSKMGFEQESI